MDFQLKKVSCGTGILSAKSLRTGKDAHPTKLGNLLFVVPDVGSCLIFNS